MKYKIYVSDDENYIILKVVGEINRQIAMKINLEAHSMGRELGINKYLVDVTKAKNTDSTMDSYDFVNKDMSTSEGIDFSARVATLVSPGDSSHDFIETVAINSGLNVRIFTDLNQALSYMFQE
jgi:hypothetical protein